MLQKNLLQPPRPFASRESRAFGVRERIAPAFISADDFDCTGILTGVDPCESRYWWMPELYTAERPPSTGGRPDADTRSATPSLTPPAAG